MAASTPARAADRNLLFGILALQLDFIGRDALILAMNAWVLDKSKPLGQVLQEQKALTGERRTLLEALVEEHLKQHGGDPEKSLAAVSSVGSVRDELKQIADADLHASLAQVSALRPKEADPEATRGSSVGAPTAAGLRFRILRPHARGGLGQVSVALDEELHREVALKEIQERHADDPESRARFLVEAEITGGLEHPGIVPVYGLGTYADGRPYYAMRFIRGDSLKDAIERFHKADVPGRDPGERALALRQLLRRFIDVCNALAYAHSRGVLHRDLKPGNIMLGKYGETLVVDWGLAKAAGRAEATADPGEPTLRPASASGSAETLPGSAMGTPQFMSPEQAAGRLDLLGPGSDVYSLGVTLYCLLTGRTPFEGGDLGKVLQRVQCGDFAPPRQCKPAVPTALEAVCLKAMAVRPEDRYGSARGLADDLEHWLADEPVSAWKEPWPARTGRWARRHKTAVAAAACLLVSAVAALAISTVLIGREQARTETARQRAEVNYARAREVVDKLTRLGSEKLAEVPQLEYVRRELLQEALTFYQGFLKEKTTDPRVRQETARAYRRMGQIHYRLGQDGPAEENYGRSIALLTSLAAEFPDVAAYRADLADTHDNLGIQLKDRGRVKDAEQAYRKSLELRARLVAEASEVRQYRAAFAETYNLLSTLLRNTGQSAEAEQACKNALELQQQLAADFPTDFHYRAALASTHDNLGNLLMDAGAPPQAEEAYRKALELHTRLVQEFPSVPRLRANLAQSYHHLGNLLGETDRPWAGEQAFKEALKLHQRLANDFPAVPHYRTELANDYSDLAHLLATVDEAAVAEQACRKGLELQERLAAEFPGVPQYRADLAYSHANLSLLLHDLGHPREAAAACDKALKLQTKLATDFPKVLLYRADLAVSEQNHGKLLQDAGQFKDAEQAYRKVLALRNQLVAESAKGSPYRIDVANTHDALGDLLKDAGRPRQAEQAYQKALAVRMQLATDFPAMAQYAKAVASSHHKLAWLLATTNNPQVRDPRLAVQIVKKAIDSRPSLASFWTTLGVAQYRAGDWSAAVAALQKAMELRKNVEEGDGDGNDRFFLAMAHWKLGRQDEARTWYRQAVAWMNEYQPQEKALLAIRGEAADLLGFPKEPDKPTPPAGR